ncbi:MAG TPA: hypothetical protein VH502_06385 [Actinoplanes sp.]
MVRPSAPDPMIEWAQHRRNGTAVGPPAAAIEDAPHAGGGIRSFGTLIGPRRS